MIRGTFIAAAMSGAIATAASAQTTTQTVPASKLFPLLDTYLSLPVDQRDRFHPQYVLTGKSAPADFHIVLKRIAGDLPIGIGADGVISPLPGPDDLKTTQVSITGAKGATFGVGLRVVATVTPAQTMDVAPLKAGIDQARAGAKKAAGLMAMMAPNFETVCFVGAGSGSVLLANGKSVALRISAPPSAPKFLNPCLTPADMPDARQVTLDHAPSTVMIVRRPAN